MMEMNLFNDTFVKCLRVEKFVSRGDCVISILENHLKTMAANRRWNGDRMGGVCVKQEISSISISIRL